MATSAMEPITRFAPSPTGYLHLGHAFSAKIAHDLAKMRGGRFLLRHEDIDSSRVRDHFYQAIEEDLAWLGVYPDSPAIRQSERLEAYDSALSVLRTEGLIYPCFCTRKEILTEIQAMGGAPHDPASQVYPGTCRLLSEEQANAQIESGMPHALRFHSEKAATRHGPLFFTDQEKGKIAVDPSINGDAVLARKDVGIAYHLAVVVDDEFQQITHVTRGEDLLTSTHIHRQLQAILEYREPLYFHHHLLRDEQGKRLAKRHDSLSIRRLREQGHSPQQVLDMIR